MSRKAMRLGCLLTKTKKKLINHKLLLQGASLNTVTLTVYMLKEHGFIKVPHNMVMSWSFFL